MSNRRSLTTTVSRDNERRTDYIVGYFLLWSFLACLAFALNVINVDWTSNPLWLGITLLLITGLLQGSVLELVAMATTTAVLGGHRRQPRSAPFEHLSLILNYNLLAVSTEDVDETFRTMHDAYLGNMGLNISAVLVSATNDAELKRYELETRDAYRQKIYNLLFDEGLSFANSRYDLVDNFRMRYVWLRYARVSRDEFIGAHLDSVARRHANNFMCIHRVSRVLKKCGQYQDLMLLSEGDNYAFSYTDVRYYGRLARPYGQSLFHASDDVRQILGRRFDYTLVLDGDTAVSPGVAYELLGIAAAYPDRGIVQPAIRMDVGRNNDATLFMHIESVRQRVNDPITNAFTEMLGQSGFYGKGLIRNRIYIDNVIGTRCRPIERVPIDVLSHDTFEAACLRPIYASNVYLLEAPCLNYVTWDMRETRWNKGEILLAMYFWPKTIGRALRALQRRLQGTDFVATRMRTKSNFDFVSAYVAHSALRNMFMKPLLLLYLLVHMFVRLQYPFAPVCVIMMLILVYPKFAVYDGTNFKLILVEVLTSVFQFTPEAFVGSARVLRAIRGNMDRNARWVPQRAIEDEFRKCNPFVSSIRHLWALCLSAAVITAAVIFLLDGQAVNSNYLVFTMIGTLFLLPFFTAVTMLSPVALRYFSAKHIFILVVRSSQWFKLFKVVETQIKPKLLQIRHLLFKWFGFPVTPKTKSTPFYFDPFV